MGGYAGGWRHPGGAIPRGQRHRRQLRASGSRRAPDLPHEDDLPSFTPGSLLVDVSCDTGMGFSWAHPTSFTQPVIEVANGVHYYAVDHSPSYLWNSATWEISEALLPHLDTVLSGPAAWNSTPTISRAIEIREAPFSIPASCRFSSATTPTRMWASTVITGHGFLATTTLGERAARTWTRRNNQESSD